ncbi:MAG: hypothetical protein A2259_00340 [Candidatus Moranbacteria bacterium RIFOXYA2_FULL_43_15]|nr:MAG: hypothetical protein A2259_00340 [Candidatus Moranbacteria bacterium RIFOXYA2_FULL_43_15]
MEQNQEPKNQVFSEDIQDEESEQEGFKSWLQENLRIVISVLIVVLIAGGIYSYSNRSVEVAQDSSTGTEKIFTEDSDGKQIAATETEKADDTDKSGQKQDTQDKTADTTKDTPSEKASPEATSQETENSFVETAVQGDGTTKMARRAAANYLEKNPDSGLTAEHKIYVEDYMRKRVQSGNVKVGTSVEFSKSLIQEAIAKSKTLNDSQLKNLHQYAARVPSLS